MTQRRPAITWEAAFLRLLRRARRHGRPLAGLLCSGGNVAGLRPAFLWMKALTVIELVLVVCLAASPTECREERPLTEINSVMSCTTQGQMVAAHWLSRHPAFTLSRWRCEVNLPRQKRI